MEFIVFRSPRLNCDLSGLSVNAGDTESIQSFNKEIYSTNFSTLMIILLPCVHIFIFETFIKLGICYYMRLVLLLFMHLLVLN